MEYRKGDRVRHPRKADWGLGEVLEDSNGTQVRIFFVGAGEKKLLLERVQPEKVAASEATHPVLDNLRIRKSSSGVKYQSLPQSIEYFLERYPEGFHGARYEQEERDYKVYAHQLALELLGKDSLTELIETDAHSEIAKNALRIVNATNLIFPNEKMALRDGLAELPAQQTFSHALFGMLHGKESLEDRFSSFSKMLEDVAADKWTTASYFLFIVFPENFMFVKPTVTQHAAELCGFEINYRPQLKWLTYQSVLKFSEYLKDEIADLEPRDMIDVQSFMWCIAPGGY